MKRLALCLFWLAVAKVVLVEHLQRTALADAVLATHERTAVLACARIAVEQTGDAADAAAWSREARVRVLGGERGVDVALWQVDHADWARRYRRVSLLVSPADGGARRCRFDIAAGRAELTTH